MCDRCGCEAYIKSGDKAVVIRAQEIIRRLHLNAENAEVFEDCERILHELYSYSYPSSEESEMLAMSRWMHNLHEPIYKQKLGKYVEAAKDVFARLPTSGDAKDIITTYHQLEQLAMEIGDEDLASIKDARAREAIKALWKVHDNNLARKTKLKERYGLD